MSEHDRHLAAFLLGQLAAEPPESFTRALASMLRDAKDSHAPTSPALLNANAGTSSENGSPEASTEHPGGVGGYHQYASVRRAAEAARKQLAALSGEWRDRAKDAEQRLVDAHSEIARLNPFDREWKNPFPLANDSLPKDPAARFIDVIRYYVSMLEDGDNWSHSLSHIQECCKEFEAAIEVRRKEATLPATIAHAVIKAVEAGNSEVRLVDVPVPVPMLLKCPACDAPHVDEGEWATRRHKTHLCAACGHYWRPFNFATVGVPEAPSL